MEQQNQQNRRKKRALLINNKGWISDIKYDKMIRLYLVNPNGFGVDSIEKN